MNKQKSNSKNNRSRRKDLWYNVFSTVFMILTYG